MPKYNFQKQTLSYNRTIKPKNMKNNFVFSWAENIDGKMVHVDSVPRGLNCGCFCPNCHEELLARHGDINEHGFAHHSKNRKANLRMCYMVTLYKLAEQIIQTKKRIHVPSYYGIFNDTDINFIDVKIDSRFEREDKQPDVIATSNDNCQYLIEFVFDHKVQHKQPIDYKNMTCLEIDLSKQTLDSLEKFLLESNEDKKWINNELYFNKIEYKYRDAQRPVRIVLDTECYQCEIRHSCCEIKELRIRNNGNEYRLCNVKQYKEILLEKHKDEENRQKQLAIRLKRLEELKHIELTQKTNVNSSYSKEENNIKDQTGLSNECIESERSCLNCKSNLKWANKNDGFAYCGCYKRLGFRKGRINPNYAKECRNFEIHNDNQ